MMGEQIQKNKSGLYLDDRTWMAQARKYRKTGNEDDYPGLHPDANQTEWNENLDRRKDMAILDTILDN